MLGLLVALFGSTTFFQPSFRDTGNLSSIMRWVGLYGIISIGVAFVIITGGIDLSIGSLIALAGVMTPMLLVKGEPFFNSPVGVPVAFAIVLGISLLIGLFHGIMVTKLKIQPFLVTLCGLFIYRGLARAAGNDQTQGFGGQYQWLKDALVKQKIFEIVPMSFLVMIVIGVVAAIVLNKTVFGRYLLAIGHNEDAARFSGIKTDRMKIAAYMICSLLGGFGGILFVLDTNGATPSSFGNFYELYAIAGAVLGGCSLRGGEGAIFGVICGAALVQVSEKAVFFLGVEEEWKFAVIGTFILVGVVADELFRRWNEKRRRL
ncbi:MAG: ABC transporter permease [Akkermansiaceae bacterium]|nr:ABC transporter permease [Akkermansiaceae bacterium]